MTQHAAPTAPDHLGRVLADCAVGRPPEPDGEVVVVPPAATNGPGVAGAVVAFTDHLIVSADVDHAEVVDALGEPGVRGALTATFLQWLARRTGTVAGALDVVFVGRGTGSGADGLIPVTEHTHRRVRRALRHRRAVEVFRHPAGGVLVFGDGLTGRREIAFEVDHESRNHGLGRNLVAAALALTPVEEPVFAQVSPGNVASMRAVLAGGFVPVAAEVLLLSSDA